MISTERIQGLCCESYIGEGFMSYGNYNNNCSSEEAAFIGSEATILMANEESNSREKTEQDHDRDKDWLQLSIGGPRQDLTTDQTSRKNGSTLVELALMPSSSSGYNNTKNNNDVSADHSLMRSLGSTQDFRTPRPATMNNYAALNSPSIVSHQQLYTGNSSWGLFPARNEEAVNWGFRPQFPISIAASSSCSSSSSFSYPSSLIMAPSDYIPRPFKIYSGLDMAQRPGLDFRVVQSPRRPHAGLWFMLQAMQNQEKEPYLPQIPKSYLRIKDGKTTIGLVMKYLVNKLNLENESEIVIICKGQRVPSLMTLQHVRDSIWNNSTNTSKDFITLLPNSSTTDYLMVLHYGRSAQTSD